MHQGTQIPLSLQTYKDQSGDADACKHFQFLSIYNAILGSRME
jgi:hypothetical protein